MIRAIYAIRHQFAGIITTRHYVREPSAEQIEEARQRYGAAGWARAVPMALEVPDDAPQLSDYLDEYPEEPAQSQERSGLPGLRFRAIGVAVPPSGDGS